MAILSQLEDYKDPFKEEKAVFDHFTSNWTTNPKKLQKLATRMIQSGDYSEYLVEGVLKSVLRTRDPLGYLKECINQHADYAVIIPDFIEQGFHGIIKDKWTDTLYPLEVKALAKWLKLEDRWSEEQEIEIMETAVSSWMEANGSTKFDGKVLLFPIFGFSGYFRVMKFPRKE
jgi:hypothetical protein